MPSVEQIQIALFRKMTPANKIRLAENLYANAFFLKMKWIEHRHPDWPENRVRAETKKIFQHART